MAMELKYVHGHTLHNLGTLKGNWASPHTGMILIEIMTSYPSVMKTLAQAFICLSHASLYQLVQLVVRLEEVATRLYKACNKIVGLECVRSYNLLMNLLITLYKTSIPRL